MEDSDQQYEFLRPIVEGWKGKIAQAVKARKGFDAVAEQCQGFFSGAIDFMWKPEFRNKYMGGKVNPRFKITLQKAFELVAIFGPVLYWKNPVRTVKPRRGLRFDAAMFGAPDDPQTEALFQQAQAIEAQREAGHRVRAMLLREYLNYTPDEMPDGGLAQHSELAITEALVSGRGVLWPEMYKMPGSQRTLTGCFWDTHKNLLIDPDATGLSDAWWIARKHCKPIWWVERKFNLPKGSLEGKGTIESGNSQGERLGDDLRNSHHRKGESNDLIEYYEIYSKMGVGARLTGVTTTLRESFDRVVGDYAYIVVSPNVPYPLNAPSKSIKQADDEAVEKMFRWPIPYWRDDRWPCAVLDFYRQPNSAWPIAPLAPGLGELTYLNVFVSHLAGRVWSSSRDFIAVMQSAVKHVRPALESGDDMAILEIPDIVQKSLDEAIKFIQQPQVNKDSWNMIDRMMHQFERRTGLSELLYGLNPGGTASRTATDAEAKQQATQVRPDYMAGKVEAWQSDAADLEKFAARWNVEAQDVQELLGPVGAHLWAQYITDEDPELVVREMRVTVEAGSARKPNKKRDVDNINSVLPHIFPELSKHADATGDTGPLNAFLDHWGEAIDLDVRDMQMGQRIPQGDPAQQQAAEQQMQMEQGKLQAELEGKQIENQGKQMELALKQAELQGAGAEAQQREMELEFESARAMQGLEHESQKHDFEMTAERERFMQNLDHQAAEQEIKMRGLREQMRLKASEKRTKEKAS